MNFWKPLAGVFALLSMVLAWYALNVHRELTAVQTASAAQGKDLADVRQTAEKYKTRLDRIEAQRKATAERRAAAAKEGGGVPAARAGQPVDLKPYLEKDPDYARVEQHRLLRYVMQQYGPALRELNLPPDQLEKLKQLLIERMQAPLDARAAALQQGIDPNSRAMGQAVQQSLAEITSEIKNLVGDDGEHKLESESMESALRMQIQSQYAGDLSAAGVPLTAAQIDALAQAQAQAQQQALQAMRAGPPGPGRMLDFQQVQRQALLDAASKVLTPEQVAALQDSVTANQEFQAMIQRAREAAEKELGHPVRSTTISMP